MLRLSLFSAVAALALLVAPLSPASAGQKNYAPTYQTATSNAYGIFGSANALSLNTNSVDQTNLRVGGKKIYQDNYAPTHQTATSNSMNPPARKASRTAAQRPARPIPPIAEQACA